MSAGLQRAPTRTSDLEIVKARAEPVELGLEGQGAPQSAGLATQSGRSETYGGRGAAKLVTGLPGQLEPVAETHHRDSEHRRHAPADAGQRGAHSASVSR